MTYETILEAMVERYRGLTGIDPDGASDIGIRMRVLAQRVFDLYGDLAVLRDQVFPQTSSGRYLEMHAQTRNIFRKQAIGAQGALRFSRETPAQADITIPAGIICATRPDPQVQFRTAEDGVLAAGEVEVLIPAVALDAGAVGNVGPGSICLMVTPAAGITSVTNPEAFTGGVDGEGDDALRQRLLESYQNISNGTNSAFYYDIAMSREGVASVRVLPRNRGRGTVDVVIACHSQGAEGEVAAALEEELAQRKEINVDVRVLAAGRDIVPVSAELSVSAGYAPQTVLDRCAEAVRDYVDGLEVGQSLLRGVLGKVLLGVDGVYNYRIHAPATDIVPQNDHVIRAGEVGMLQMEVE